MTVQDTTNKFNFTGDGATTIFPWSNIKIINNSDMTVYVDDVLKFEGVDYSIDYDEDTTNGSITFFTPPPNASTGLGVRDMPLEQPFKIPIDSDFDAEKNETMADNTVLIIQDQQDELNRALKAPSTFTGSFESEIVGQDMIVVGNDTGTGFKDSGVNIVTLNTDLGNAVAEAEASAAAALVSENNAAGSAASAASNVLLTNADVVSTNADVVQTNADVVQTNADVVSSGLNAAAAAQSALDAEVAKIEWQGAYNAGTAYALNDAVEYNGSSYISLVDSNTGNTPDASPTQWDLIAQRGSDGSSGGSSAYGVFKSSTPTSLPSSTVVVVRIDTADVNVNCTVDPVNFTITPQDAGVYEVTAQVSFSSVSASGNMSVIIEKNGGSLVNLAPSAIAGSNLLVTASTVVAMDGVTDLFRLRARIFSATAKISSGFGYLIIKRIA